MKDKCIPVAGIKVRVGLEGKSQHMQCDALAFRLSSCQS